MNRLVLRLRPTDNPGPLMQFYEELGRDHGGQYTLSCRDQRLEFSHEDPSVIDLARYYFENVQSVEGNAQVVSA